MKTVLAGVMVLLLTACSNDSDVGTPSESASVPDSAGDLGWGAVFDSVRGPSDSVATD